MENNSMRERTDWLAAVQKSQTALLRALRKEAPTIQLALERRAELLKRIPQDSKRYH